MTEWRTPIKPMQPGRLWCVWESRGTYEWMVHPDTGRELLEHGIVINGESCRCEQVGEWPRINAIQIRAVTRSYSDVDGWVEPAQTTGHLYALPEIDEAVA
jgi:hypothetical protein